MSAPAESVSLLEPLAEDPSRRLADAEQALQAAQGRLARVYSTVPSSIWVIASDGAVLSANRRAEQLLSIPSEQLVGASLQSFFTLDDGGDLLAHLAQLHDGETLRLEAHFVAQDQTGLAVLLYASKADDQFVVAGLDVSEQRRMEVELRHALKMEAVGSLAAGIAHEINTPLQYVGDNLDFLEQAFRDVDSLLALHRRACAALPPDARETLTAAERQVDLDFLRQEAPAAFLRSREGLNRVGEIVGSMREFMHPGRERLSLADLNRSLESAFTLTRNAVKHVAQVEINLGEIPPVECNPGDVGQVFINLIVNAAQAIAESGIQPGLIRAATCRRGDHVLVSISDNGPGIPASIQGRVYDPFFTTKGVGQGTGQGLSLCRTIVRDRHGGEIWFETPQEGGTTFFVQLPVTAPRKPEAAPADMPREA